MNSKKPGVAVNAKYVSESPAAVAKAMTIMGGWMFFWTGLLLLLMFV